MNRDRHILILGGDADGNLGDRAILAAMCQALREIDPTLHLTVVSKNPQATRERLNVNVIPRGLKGMPALCAAARRSRLVLVGGGGLFQDDDSLIKMPYWAARCALMRLLCPRIASGSLGAGPLHSGGSRLSAMIAFAVMFAVSVRDRVAQQTVQPLTAKKVAVVPDPAFMLEPATEPQAKDWLASQGVPLNDGPLIGVTVRRWFPAQSRWVPNLIAARFSNTDKQDAQSSRLVALYAQALDQLVERTGGRVVMMPTYNVAHEGDDRLCQQVIDSMQSDRTHLVHVDDPAFYKSVARELAVMVGGRMHSTIFAASVGTPVVGLAYNPKFIGVFDLLGLSHRVMTVESFVQHDDVAGLVRKVEDAMADRTPLCKRSEQLADQTRSWLSDRVREVMP